MLLLPVRPPAPALLAFVLRHDEVPLNYDEVGASRMGEVPFGWKNEAMVELGRGQACFEAARQACLQWRMFDQGWVELVGREERPAPGRVVATLARVLGVWALLCCRVVYRHDEMTPEGLRAGFGYGTVRGHLLRGEERFEVRMAHDGRVTWHVLSFSAPGRPLGWLAWPLVRVLQRRFVTQSGEAMRRAVAASA